MVRWFAIGCLAPVLAGWAPAAFAATCSERLLPPQNVAPGKRDIAARDLVELRDFGRMDNGVGGEAPFSLSPDGRQAALILRRADPDSDSYCFGLILVALDGTSAARLLDSGGEFIQATSDIRGVPAIASGVPKTPPPLWAPDGRSLVYLRRDHGSTQVWRVGLGDGPAEQVTSLATDALAVAWAADGRSILVTTRPSLDAGAAVIEREGKAGFLYDARFWSLSEDRPRPPLPLPSEIQAVDLMGGASRVVTATEAAQLRSGTNPVPPADALLYVRSQSGAVAWTAYDDAAKVFGPARLHVEVGGKALPCPPTICSERVAALWWVGPGELLFMRSGSPENGGRQALYRWRVGVESAPQLLFQTSEALIGCQPDVAALVCAHESATRPRELVSLDPSTGRLRTLFDPNPEFDHLRLGRVERLAWTDRQGVATYGDLVLPPGYKKGDRLPLIIVQYVSRGFLRGGTGDEYPIHLLAGQGYAVLSFQMPSNLAATDNATDINALQRINISNWAGRRRIFEALDAGVDAVIARGVADRDRIGITGMSDGATTAQFALNNSGRFKAAVLSSCCDEPSGLFVVGPAYRDAIIAWGYPVPGADGRAFWAPQSLTQNAARMRTPLLIEEPDMEYRLALEAVSALQYSGAPVEMHVFADEHHVKWHPVHRLAIYRRNLAWFDFWLRDKQSADPDLRGEMQRWRAMKLR